MNPTAYLTAALLALTILRGAAAETEWPQFRGPGGQGMSAAKGVPIEWDAEKNVMWKVECAGRGWSSPVVSKGRLYLTAAVDAPNGDGATLHTLCLDGADGRTLWDTEVFQPDAASLAAIHKKNSPASATPIVSGDRLYVHFGHMGTAALDLTGKIVWKQTEVKYTPIHGNGGSPVLVGGLLVFSCDGAADPFVIALDAATGEIRWKTPRQSPAKKQFSFSTPLAIEIGGGTQIVSCGPGFVGGYQPQDGRELWRVGYGEGYSVVCRPVFAHGLLFVDSGFDYPVLLAIRPEGASGDATASNIAWTGKKGVPQTASMVVVGDELYYVSDAGIAACADARTGEVRWSERLGGNFSASPVVAEGRIYFQNETGIGYVVKAEKTYTLLAKNELGEPTLASPAVIDGTLFLRSDQHVWKIGKR